MNFPMHKRRNMWRRWTTAILFGLVVCVFACEPSDGTNTPPPDGTMCSQGDEKPADDGCNTCICDDGGNWACTAMACPPNECEPDECGPALGMPNYECPDGVTMAGPGDCKRNEEGLCAWEIIECPSECVTGETKNADDGCNTCECTEDGTWACTDMACPPAECTAGETKDADDGCNTCECTEDGFWACTEEVCPLECGPDDCVVAPGMPNYLCPDGVTMAGPGECIVQEGDMCGWEIIECPAECVVGETKDADDDCNTCECTEDGFWACTEMVCPACGPDECGPMPAMPNKLCPDGVTMSGPTGECIETKDGCGWEIIECPDDCPPIKCGPNEEAVDTDNDGCADTCKDKKCEPFKCPVGQTPIDTDSDGCPDACDGCKPVLCPAGKIPVDTDNDGCKDACQTKGDCPPLACLKGQKKVDTDNDGCLDKCFSNCPPPAMGVCPEDQWPADTDGDGCPDQCVAKGTCQTACDCYDQGATFPKPCNASCVGCGPYWNCSATGSCTPACGAIPDKVKMCGADTCPPILCEDGAEPIDMSGDGCPETCVPIGSACTPGDTQPADDGCNTCICMETGEWACTKKFCGGDLPCTAGDEKDAGDGCNTCTCTANGKWACTEMTCGDQCVTGETKDADDGCNTCFCTDDGQWACTKKMCPECPPPKPFEGICIQVVATAINPLTGMCCDFPTPCNIPDGWQEVGDKSDCTSGGDMTPVPTPGKTPQ